MKVRQPRRKRALKRKLNTWGSIFRNALRRGDDHGYAAFLADQWEARMKNKSPVKRKPERKKGIVAR